MATTTNGYPYPAGSDTADVPRDIYALAYAVDTKAASLAASNTFTAAQTVLTAGSVATENALLLSNPRTAGDASPSIQFWGNGTQRGTISSGQWATGTNGYMRFDVSIAGSQTTHLTLYNNSVGVGTATPSGGMLLVNNLVAANVGLIVKGAATQSGDLQQWQNSAGTVLSSVNSLGYLGVGVAAASTIPVKVSGAALGGTASNSTNLTTFTAAAGNNVNLNTYLYRYATGTDWTGVEVRVEHQVDSTSMGSLVFNPSGLQRAIALRTNGVDRLTVDNSTNSTVYFGNGYTNTTPTDGYIAGTSGSGTDVSAGNLYLSSGASTGAGGGGVIIFRTNSVGTTGSTLNSVVERMRINNSGSLIIGNGGTSATPANANLYATSGSGTNVAGASFNINGGYSTGTASGGPVVIYTSDAGAVSGTSANALVARLAVAANGNVGIGTTGPTSMLTIYKNSATAVQTNHGNSVATWLSGIDASGNYSIYSNNAYNVIFSTSGTERMRITSTGLVGIGVTPSGAMLHVVNNTAANVGLLLKGAASQSGDLVQVQNSSGTSLVKIDSAGHLTVEGVTSTGATGTGKFVFDASPTITGHPTVEGVTATGATGTGKFVFDTAPVLSAVDLAAGTATAGTAPLMFTSGTNLTVAEAGAVEYDGTNFYGTQSKAIRAPITTPFVFKNQNSITIANTSATGLSLLASSTNASASTGIALAAATTYEFEMRFIFSSTGTTSHTEAIGFYFSGTTSYYNYEIERTLANVASSATRYAQVASGTTLTSNITSTVATPAIAATVTNAIYVVRGWVTTNTAGNWTPVIVLSAQPGATSTVSANATFKIAPYQSSSGSVNLSTWA